MAKDDMINEIIQQMMGEEEPQEIMPGEVEEIVTMGDDMLPEISIEEFAMMPESGGFLDAMNQMTGQPDEDAEAEMERDFYGNFVEQIPIMAQKRIALDLIQKVQGDIDSRRSWEDTVVSTMKTLGIAQNIDKDKLTVQTFDNASNVEYPMLIRASIQYASRSVPEILTNKLAKVVIIGKSTTERKEQAMRAESAINYQLGYLDKGFYSDFRKGELYKCLCGSIFRKAYHDPILDQNITRLIKPQDFIIHYEQVDFDSCSRYTHRMHMSNNELRKLQLLGHYADVDVGHGTIAYDEDEITKEIDKMDGYDVGRANAEASDLYHTIYEVHCNLDIPGFEDMDDSGNPTGLELPYIVVVHKETSKILSIRRNWKYNDPKKRKQVWFIHYQFLPGTGFYGFGYAHLIGSLARASTALLRAILDGTALHLLKGGFKTADAKIDGDKCISPGEFRTLEGTYDDIRKALYPLEFSAPSTMALQILQFLDKTGADMVINTEVMVGSANNNGPVGTTLALIEQGQKVYTAIHQATHRSFGEELCLLAKLNFEYMPEQFEFAAADGAHFVYRSDFDESIRVIPVSDPNIASFQQRQAIDQATLQMAAQFPQYFKLDKVIRRIMENLSVPAIDEIMYTPEEMQQQQQQQMENPPPNQLQAEQALQQQKIDGELQKEQLRSDNKIKELQAEAEYSPEDLRSVMMLLQGGMK